MKVQYILETKHQNRLEHRRFVYDAKKSSLESLKNRSETVKNHIRLNGHLSGIWKEEIVYLKRWIAFLENYWFPRLDNKIFIEYN